MKTGECDGLDWKERISCDLAFGRPVDQAVEAAIKQLENCQEEADRNDLMKLYIYSGQPMKALQLA